jgi:hypothetical protein
MITILVSFDARGYELKTTPTHPKLKGYYTVLFQLVARLSHDSHQTPLPGWLSCAYFLTAVFLRFRELIPLSIIIKFFSSVKRSNVHHNIWNKINKQIG